LIEALNERAARPAEEAIYANPQPFPEVVKLPKLKKALKGARKVEEAKRREQRQLAKRREELEVHPNHGRVRRARQ
jgi:hypothetical protein